LGRQDRRARAAFGPLQQVVRVLTGVAVVRIAHVGAFAEERLGFVELQCRTGLFGARQHRAEVLLRFPDVLADDLQLQM
jgi:hypothetical protein